MALDAQYILSPSLEMLFRDKTTGDPLAAGTVEFYIDSNRTTPKNVYKLSGTEPNYTYTALSNPVTLSSVGTFQDGSGNDIIPYLFPYDANGDVELYYVVIKDSSGTVQFTREAWPNTIADDTAQTDYLNYIPNGKFLLHNTPLTISALETDIAQGGWKYIRDVSSGYTDIVTFPQFSGAVASPIGFPRYYCQLENSAQGAARTRNDIVIRFPDVTTFTSDTGQLFTLYFEGKSGTGSNVAVSVNYLQHFGAGGASDNPQPIGSVSLGNSYTKFTETFSFDAIASKLIGTGNDDYVEIILRFPLGEAFTAHISSFILTLGEQVIATYPPITNAEMITESIIANFPTPAADGSDLFLPLTYTLAGLTFDDSQIGKIFPTIKATADLGEKLCDGSKLITTEISTDKVPHSRLQSVIYDSTLRTPIFGTGADFFTAAYPGSGDEFRVVNNTLGAVTITNVGTSGFTLRVVHTGSATYGVTSYLTATDTLYIENTALGEETEAAAGTSGFTVATVQRGASLPQISSVKTLAAAGLDGLYFEFTNATPTTQRVGYKVAAGTPPAGTTIQVNLETADTAAIVASKTQEAINAFNVSNLTTVDASALSGGEYFTASSTGAAYYVWYTKDGSGTDPAPGGTGIEVATLTGDTAAVVATKTQSAINSFSFALPDLRGTFLRGWDDGAGVDPDAATRWSLVPGIIGDVIGTSQLSANIAHKHDIPMRIHSGNPGSNPFDDGTTLTGDAPISIEGGPEARPINTYVNYVIKY